jgi:hypothetical protein
MWSHRRARRRELRLEAALRRHRSEPRQEFVQGLTSRFAARQTERPRAFSRLAFAAAASTLILGTFASFGGMTYAASGATSTYHVVKQVVVKHKVSVRVHKSSAADEYPPANEAPAGTEASGGAPNEDVLVAGASQTLPFTGISLVSTVVISLALILLGLALRRRERRN